MEKFLKHKNEMDEVEFSGKDLYETEFMKLRDESDRLKADPLYSTSDGEKPCNVVKNRYKDIIPFNYNRVKLKDASDTDSDYFNASFIKGAGSQLYIASQGPLQKTVTDFWSTVWDYNIRVVIMSCQEYEGKKLKCFRYWNQSKDEELVFGKFTVKLLEESILGNTNGSVVRRKMMVKKNNEETKAVVQLHHTKWPDKFIPMCVDSILALLIDMRAYHGEEKAEPVLFHCSAGCGRTGTLIVIDYIWSMIRKEMITDTFSLFDVIINMRKQRMAIVQSLDQYQFVYGAVAKLFEMNKNALKQHQKEIHVSPETSQTPSLPPPKFPVVYVKGEVKEHNKKGLQGDCGKIVKDTGFIYKGYDIGFPNRVGRPVGPRPIPPLI